MPEPQTPTGRVFVTVGTDHHPFQRLVNWADRLASRYPQLIVTVQYGTARPPTLAVGQQALAHEDMLAAMREADVVIAQGGPGGIMDSRACGRLPIVVPRDPARGEHVDDHQIRFATHMHHRGRILMARTEAELHLLVRRALEAPAEFTVTPQASPTASTAAAVDAALKAAIAHAHRHRPLGHPSATSSARSATPVAPTTEDPVRSGQGGPCSQGQPSELG